MAQEVFMEIQDVQNLAKTIGNLGEILQQANNILEQAVNALKTDEFTTKVGLAAAEAHAIQIKPTMESLIRKMHELQGDIQGAISNYETGDTSGSNRFR